MEINYNLISLVEFLGLIQGTILGTLIIVIFKQKNDISILFLGFFILVFTLQLVPLLIKDLNILSFYPSLNLLPFSFNWLMPALYYVYVKTIPFFPKTTSLYRMLIPGAVAFIIDFIIFLLPAAQKSVIANSLWYNVFQILGLLFSLIILVILIRFLNRYLLQTKKQPSSFNYRKLLWLRNYSFIGVVYIIVYKIPLFFFTNIYYELIFTLIKVFLLYEISLRCVLQKHVKLLLPRNQPQRIIITFKRWIKRII